QASDASRARPPRRRAARFAPRSAGPGPPAWTLDPTHARRRTSVQRSSVVFAIPWLFVVARTRALANSFATSRRGTTRRLSDGKTNGSGFVSVVVHARRPERDPTSTKRVPPEGRSTSRVRTTRGAQRVVRGGSPPTQPH